MMKSALKESTGESTVDKSRTLRLWPALSLVVVTWIRKLVLPSMPEESFVTVIMTFMGPMVCGLAILLWWLFASRATWKEKLFAVLFIAIGAIIGNFLTHPSIRGIGFLLFGVA